MKICFFVINALEIILVEGKALGLYWRYDKDDKAFHIALILGGYAIGVCITLKHEGFTIAYLQMTSRE